MRRSGLKIMLSLTTMIGSGLGYVMLLAIINGSVGFMCAISITVLGSVGVAKLLGASIALSYTALFLIIIGFGVLRGILRYFEQYSNHYIAFKLLSVLRDKIFSALRLLCPAKLETKQKGSIISMITSDIETLEVFYAHTISPICIALIVSSAMTLFIGFVVSWYMAIVALAAYLVLGVILPILYSKFLGKAGVAYRENFTSFNGFYMDWIKGSREIILHGKQKHMTDNVNDYSDNLLANAKEIRSRTSLVESVTIAVITLLNLTMLSTGIILVANGLLSVQIMIIGVVALMSSMGPVIAINALPNNLNQTFASGDRVINLLSEQPQVQDIENGTDFDFESVEIVGLKFAYDDSPVLSDINLMFERGKITGIMGKSGCGKSTILKLLLRFWERGKGEILYNGIPIDQINSSSLKSNVTMVSQTTYLFNDSIRGNLLIANQDATDEELVSACKKASIHDYIMLQQNKYDTIIGASGLELSAGEKQRIGLARAFLSNAKLILLDEPTSNVDSINEGIILKSLRDNSADKAIVIVSHRQSTMSIADKVYKIDDGGVINE